MKTKRILIGLMAGTLATMCVGCGKSNQNNGDTNTTSTGVSTSVANENKEVTYKQNEAVKFGNEEVVVNDVVKGYTMTADESTSSYGLSCKPAEGNRYVKVTVTIKNISSVQASLNSSEFKLQNSQGQLLSTASPNSYLKDKFQTLTIMPGGTSKGSMIFEAPINDSGIKLVYTPVVGKGMLIFDL